jgi:hypothetical protein
MILTSRLKGGLGNQLFQISIVFAMANELGCDYVFVVNQFDGCRQGNHPNTYYKNVFSKLKFVDHLPKKTIQHVNEKRYTYDSTIKSIIQPNVDIVLLNGYFQSELYFKKYKQELKQLFLPTIGCKSYLSNHTNILDRFPKICDTNNCFIGVRRGDYMTHKNHHLPCHIEFYKDAIKLMNDKCSIDKFYILSDDLDWCKSQFVGTNYVFLDDVHNDYIQLYCMTLFKNYIISNSTFYWWGSYLSTYDDPFVICPKYWINHPDHETIYRDDMIILERSIE